MSSVMPPDVVVEEFLSATTRHTRRIEIYEQDGITRWVNDDKVRLKTGSVTVDFSRNERRALDLTLSNSDGAIKTGAGYLWYDKVIKVFRGALVNEKKPNAKVLIVGDLTLAGAPTGMAFHPFRLLLSSLGYVDVTYGCGETLYADVSTYDLFIGLGSGVAASRAILLAAYNSGKSVLAFGGDADAFIPALNPGATGVTFTDTTLNPVVTSTSKVAKGWSVLPVVGPLKAWTTTTPDASGISKPDDVPTRFAVNAFSNATTNGSAVTISASFDYASLSNTDFISFLKVAMGLLDKYVPVMEWEVQVGEFMIDRITEVNFPKEIRITGRDYTKKCLLSKFTRATQFSTGLSLESIIGSIASNAGIVRRSLPATGIVVNKTFFFDRGVTRWDAMAEIAKSYNYELYFDASGYLVMREYRDPSTTPPAIYLHTGERGQLASWQKSTTDARLYNHILVTGESSDQSRPPVYGEAINTSPTSPTSVDEIGDRLYQYTSSFITTVPQAQAVADSFLAVHSLEEFEISFASLMLPWLEVGDIADIDDGQVSDGDPTLFLLSALTIPLALGPMSGTGKRVTIVG